MVQRGSFARNWNLIKIARSWHPHEIAGELLSRLMERDSPGVHEQLKAIAHQLGTDEGNRFLARTPEGMDDASILESYFLVSGIPCEVERENGFAQLFIKKEPGNIFFNQPGMERLITAFFSGFVRAISDSAIFIEKETYIVVQF